MTTQERDNVIAAIKDAVNACKVLIATHLNRPNKNDHSNIDYFQLEITDCLNKKHIESYTWKCEIKTQGRLEKDSIDILGTCKGKPDFIIEIDASRGDQVAKKLLSRIALRGIGNINGKKKEIHYVAILYPNTQPGGKSESEKMVHYGNVILKGLNKESSAIGIYLDGYNLIEVWDFDKKSKFSIYDRKSGNTVLKEGLIDCAKYVISDYIKKHGLTKYADVRKQFDKYVDEKSGPSRYRKLCTLDKTVFVYSQWREYGIGENWTDFVIFCKKKGYIITKVW